MKNLCFLTVPFSKNKLLTFGIFNESNIWATEKLRYMGQLLLKVRAVEVSTIIEYRLDQLNNKHTKIAVNSAIQYFESCYQIKCLLKV